MLKEKKRPQHPPRHHGRPSTSGPQWQIYNLLNAYLIGKTLQQQKQTGLSQQQISQGQRYISWLNVTTDFLGCRHVLGMTKVEWLQLNYLEKSKDYSHKPDSNPTKISLVDCASAREPSWTTFSGSGSTVISCRVSFVWHLISCDSGGGL